MAYIVRSTRHTPRFDMFTLSANQVANLAVNNHIEWDTQETGDFILSLGAGQADGLITLPRGFTYELQAELVSFDAGLATNYIDLQWYDVTNAVAIGKMGFQANLKAGSRGVTDAAIAIFTPEIDVQVETRIMVNPGITTVYERYSRALITEIPRRVGGMG